MKINDKFKDLLMPLSDEEKAGLEASILKNGVIDPLIVWRENETLIDGHNRYDICQKHGIEYKTSKMSFADEHAVNNWIIEHQLSRRNVNDHQISFLRGKMYLNEKKSQGAPENNKNAGKQRGQNVPFEKTSEKVGKRTSVTGRTIKRDAIYTEAVEKLESETPGMKDAILTKAVKMTKKDVIETAKEKPEVREKIISRVKTGKAKNVKAAKKAMKKEETIAKLEDITEQEVKAVQGVFDVIVIDPPWPMKKIERDCRPNQVEFDYPTMTIQDISKMEIPAADDCHMWLWTTHKFLPDAFGILKSWGFKYVCAFTWHKPGGFQPVGLPQFNCEFALYARKGTPILTETKALPVCFNAPRGKHSEKPEEFYDVIRRVTSGRRVDMFNRRSIDGFETWGNESK